VAVGRDGQGAAASAGKARPAAHAGVVAGAGALARVFFTTVESYQDTGGCFMQPLVQLHIANSF